MFLEPCGRGFLAMLFVAECNKNGPCGRTWPLGFYQDPTWADEHVLDCNFQCYSNIVYQTILSHSQVQEFHSRFSNRPKMEDHSVGGLRSQTQPVYLSFPSKNSNAQHTSIARLLPSIEKLRNTVYCMGKMFTRNTGERVE